LLNRERMRASSEQPLPARIPVTDTEGEQSLLQTLDLSFDPHQRAEALWGLVQFYLHQAQRRDLAVALLDSMIQESVSAERRAIYCVALGKIAELNEQWELALSHYMRGLSFHPKNARTEYLLHNNLAFCHNMLAQYDVGESFCRRAIEIDATCATAYANLGIALEGKGDFCGAAFALVEAINANPEDTLPVRLLKKLVGDYPDLVSQRKWIDKELGEPGCHHYPDA